MAFAFRKVLALAVTAGGMWASCTWALEAVVQSDVGSGSAVAGSIGAVNARADALQGNVAAANLIIQQLIDQITILKKQVSNTETILKQIIVIKGADGTNGLDGVGGLNGYNGKDAVSVNSSAAGSLCGTLQWKGGGGTDGGSGKADGSFIQHSYVRAWNGQSYFLSDVIAQSPCMGEEMVANNRAHCPAGYSFVNTGGNTGTGYQAYSGADGNTWSAPGVYTSSVVFEGSCMKN